VEAMPWIERCWLRINPEGYGNGRSTRCGASEAVARTRSPLPPSRMSHPCLVRVGASSHSPARSEHGLSPSMEKGPSGLT